jgi:iron complex transport system ATP-binding protein
VKENSIVRLENLSIGYAKTKPLLSNLSFSFETGLTGIIGVNGIGKSTLLRTIAGLQNPLAGKVLINQKDCAELSNTERAAFFSVVLTEKITDAYFSVFDIVASGRSPYTGFLGNPGKEDLLIIESNLEKCGISHLAKKKCNEISDGERQKCMIARALTQTTPVMLLDEPSSYLDFRARFEIMELLSKISSEENKTIIFSSHDIEMVFKTAKSCLVILDAETVVLKSCAELVASEIPQKLLAGSNLLFNKDSLSISFKK